MKTLYEINSKLDSSLRIKKGRKKLIIVIDKTA